MADVIMADCRFVEEKLVHTLVMDYKIIFCPDGSWNAGAGFDRVSVYKTLDAGYFPVGTLFETSTETLAVGKKSNGKYKLALLERR